MSLRLLIVVSAVAAGGVLLGGGIADAGSRLPVFLGCMGTKAQVRPAEIVFACGDGNFYLASIHWNRWDATEADGTATAHQNDCTPYCAAGHFHAYPATVRLFRPETCTGGRLDFTRATYRFTGTKPARVARSDTESAPFYVKSGCP